MPGSTFRGPISIRIPKTGGAPQFADTVLFDSSGIHVGPSAAQIATVTITSAQLKALHTTPVDLSALVAALGAPGAGKLIMVNWVAAKLVYGAATYANGGALSVTYGTAGPAACPTVPAALVTAAQSETYIAASGFSAQQTAAATVNVGLFLSAASADFITGDGTLMLQINYRILSGF